MVVVLKCYIFFFSISISWSLYLLILLYSLTDELLALTYQLEGMFFYSLLLESFSHQCYLMIFHWNLSNSKSPQVSRSLISILAVLNNAGVPASKPSSPFNNPLVTVTKAPITIGIIVTFKFHSFFNSLARSRYLSFFSLPFSFILWSACSAKFTILQVLFFFVDYYKVWSSGRD